MEILKGICVVLLLLLLGLLLEKMFRPKADLSECTRNLKADICKVVKIFFTKEKIRRNLVEEIGDKSKVIVAPHSAVGMDTDVGQWIKDETPCYGVQFVPNKKLDVQELQRITDLVKICVRRHLIIKGLPWRTFACYEAGLNYVTIYVYYEEFPEDKEHFESRYEATVKEAVGLDFGCLRDEDLDRQLGNI